MLLAIDSLTSDLQLSVAAAAVLGELVALDPPNPSLLSPDLSYLRLVPDLVSSPTVFSVSLTHCSISAPFPGFPFDSYLPMPFSFLPTLPVPFPFPVPKPFVFLPIQLVPFVFPVPKAFAYQG